MTATSDKLVVDASAMGALFFREPEAKSIEKKLHRSLWVVPTLTDYEMGSLYLKKRQRYPALIPQLEEGYRIYCESAMERVEIDIRSVVPIAEKHGLTIHDASYFWLAQTLNLSLLTLDKQLLSAWAKR